MKFLSVATFSWPDHHGGAERVIGEVARRLVARGHAVTLLTSQTGGQPAAECRQGVEIRRYPVDRRSPARFYRSVFQGVRRSLSDPACAGADVAHLHQIVSGIAALAPGGVRRLPTLTHFYAPYSEEFLAKFREGRPEGSVSARARAVSRLLARGDRWLLRRADAVVVLSRFSLSQVESLAPEVLPRTRVAPAGADLERFRPARDEHERQSAALRFGLPADGPPILVTVRRLVPRMGLTDLIEALRRLHAAGRPAVLALAGTGPERGSLETQVATSGLGHHVHLLGRIEEARLPELYRAAHAFVLPTRALEGFGMATAEALASGLPVVATDVGATSDVLAGCSGAVLVRPGRSDLLAEALAERLRDPEALQRDGRAARRHAETTLGWDAHVDAVASAATAALSARRSR